MVKNKYFSDLQSEIKNTRKKIKEQYKNYDCKDEPTYDHGFLDGTLAGLKIARSLWRKDSTEGKN